MCLAIPGRVISTTGECTLARHGSVDFGGVVRDVNLSLVPEAKPDDYVLVHAGVALTRINLAEASRVMELLSLPDPEDSS